MSVSARIPPSSLRATLPPAPSSSRRSSTSGPMQTRTELVLSIRQCEEPASFSARASSPHPTLARSTRAKARRNISSLPSTRSSTACSLRQNPSTRHPIRDRDPAGIQIQGQNRHRRGSSVVCNSSSLDEPSFEGGEMQMMELPCLPFTPAEVLVPASVKPLHLYEARYLALLEEAVNKTQGLFAHIILEPVRAEGTEMSFVASNCCLCFVESVRRLEIGALVTVRGLCRLGLLTLNQMEPFLRGSVTLQPDKAQEDPARAEELGIRLEELKDTLRDVQRLQIRLKSPGDSPLQTTLEEAVQWAEKALSGKIPELSALADSPTPSSSLSAAESDVPESESEAKPEPPPPPPPPTLTRPPWPSQTSSLEMFLPSRAELVAFAALQPLTASSPTELHKLLQKRLLAMETLDSFQRIEFAKQYAEDARASLAAKLALQSLSSS